MKYLNRKEAPMCLHILGQGLVDSVHAEGRELRRLLEKMSDYTFSNIPGMPNWNKEIDDLLKDS